MACDQVSFNCFTVKLTSVWPIRLTIKINMSMMWLLIDGWLFFLFFTHSKLIQTAVYLTHVLFWHPFKADSSPGHTWSSCWSRLNWSLTLFKSLIKVHKRSCSTFYTCINSKYSLKHNYVVFNLPGIRNKWEDSIVKEHETEC